MGTCVYNDGDHFSVRLTINNVRELVDPKATLLKNGKF